MTSETTASPAVTTDLLVGGMTCAACVSRVEKRLAKLEGVTATVNLATGNARISHPPEITPEILVATVERAATPLNRPARRNPRPAARRPSRQKRGSRPRPGGDCW